MLKINSNPIPINVTDKLVAKVIEEARLSALEKDPTTANMVRTRIEEKDTSYDVEFSVVCENIKVELLFGLISVNQLSDCARRIVEVKKDKIIKHNKVR